MICESASFGVVAITVYYLAPATQYFFVLYDTTLPSVVCLFTCFGVALKLNNRFFYFYKVASTYPLFSHNASPMPRRNKADLDFEIHEDTVDEHDFASPAASEIEKGLRGDQSTLLNEDIDESDDEEYKKSLPNSAVESNMTRASTLVDEPGMEGVDGKIDAMLEDLGGKIPEEDDVSRRDSGVSSQGGDRGSRRASDVSDRSDRSRRTYEDDSVLDHETSFNGVEEETDAQASHSRRESAMSATSRNSSGTVEKTDLGSQYDDDESMLEQDDAQESRRESAVPNGSRLSRRASGRTEALIHAAARDIVAQINQDRGSHAKDAESLADDASFVSGSRLSSARPSDVHESIAEESFVSGSRVSSARQSNAHEAEAEEQSYISEPRVSSARPSDVHEAAAEDQSFVSESKVSSAWPSDAYEAPADEEQSFFSNSRTASARPSNAHESIVDEPQTPTLPAEEEDQPSRTSSPRHSDVHEVDEPLMSVEDEELVPPATDEAESSSHHENEDDVFSDHSPRSSVGSVSESDHQHQRKMESSVTQRMRAPRISDFSRLDDYADDDDEQEDFIPTVRGTPRPAFRSPSSVKALQMSSPPPSVIGSPRSSRRRTPLPTVSRLGSPSVSAQYSPKKTPPRFKRATPPLVLLHATLLPLRWAWAGVLEAATTEELSPEGKGLREAWRALQDRLGDTVCERGILLPHPQNDFEVLEERLLEALELPLRRRARILECGHYLGPSNEMTILEEEEDSEDEQAAERPSQRTSAGFTDGKTHWCATCRSDIRVEDSLGTGRIFRVKVYASNGLMKAGAWEACWKEMERVDVELEPLLEGGVQEELGRLAAEQEKALVAQPMIVAEDEDEEEEEEEEQDASYLAREEEVLERSEMPSSPPVDTRVLESPRESLRRVAESPRESMHRESRHRESHRESHLRHHEHASPPTGTVSTITLDEERRIRDEERLREIYGHTPPTHQEQTSSQHQRQDSSAEYMHHQNPHNHHHHQSPPSPSAEAYARREERRNASPQRRNESLGELLLAAFRVAMQDRRNVTIVAMSMLVLVLALRGGGLTGGAAQEGGTFQMGVKSVEVPTVTVTEREAWTRVMEDVASVVSSSSVVASSSTSTVASAPSVEAVSQEDPLSSSSSSSSSAYYSVEDLVLEEAPSPSSSSVEPESKSASSQESKATEPCSSEVAEAAVPEPETVVSERIVRVFETVTEKVFETATVTETQTAKVVETAVVEVEAEAEETIEEPVLEEQLVDEQVAEEAAAELVEDLVEEQQVEELEAEPLEQPFEAAGEVVEPVVEVTAEAVDVDETDEL